jgi:hypothetical protein
VKAMVGTVYDLPLLPRVPGGMEVAPTLLWGNPD